MGNPAALLLTAVVVGGLFSLGQVVVDHLDDRPEDRRLARIAAEHAENIADGQRTARLILDDARFGKPMTTPAKDCGFFYDTKTDETSAGALHWIAGQTESYNACVTTIKAGG